MLTWQGPVVTWVRLIRPPAFFVPSPMAPRAPCLSAGHCQVLQLAAPTLPCVSPTHLTPVPVPFALHMCCARAAFAS